MKTKNNQRTICFRRWTRKSYAVFNSLGKQIKIGVLATSLSLVAMTAQAVAAQDSATQPAEREGETDREAVPIAEVLVTGSKAMATVEPARALTIISRSEIEQLPAQNLGQLLEYVAGVDLRQRGANGVQADISIRGGTFDQALILLNGVNLTDPQTGHHNLNLPIDLESIDRIEVLQGPGSRSLGPHAFAGVVNIITGSEGRSHAQLHAEGGSHGYALLNASGALARKRWTVFSALSRSQSDGYMRSTDFGLANLFAQARYEDSTLGRWNLQLGAQQKAFGAATFYSAAYPDQHEETDAQLASLDVQKSVGAVAIAAAGYYRRHADSYLLDRSRPEFYHNLHRTDVYGGSLTLSYLSALGKSTLGGELRGEHLYSSSMGDLLPSPVQVPREPDSTFYTRGRQRNVASWFAEQVYYHRDFSLAAGLQGSWTNDFGHFLCYSADAAYSFAPALQATASVSSAVRLPTFTDLNYKSPTIEGNTALRPEQATTGEVGARLLHRDLRLHASTFYRQGKDIIDWLGVDTDGDGKVDGYRSRNLRLGTLGATFSAALAPTGPTRRWLSSAKLDYAYLRTDGGADDELSRTLSYLRHKVTLTCAHRLGAGFGLSWSLIHERRNGPDFAPVTLLDAKLSWSYRPLRLYVAASNLLNHAYADFVGLPQPGRWVVAGVAIALR